VRIIRNDEYVPLTQRDLARKEENALLVSRGLLDHARRDLEAVQYRSMETEPVRPDIAALLTSINSLIREADRLLTNPPATETEESE